MMLTILSTIIYWFLMTIERLGMRGALRRQSLQGKPAGGEKGTRHECLEQLVHDPIEVQITESEQIVAPVRGRSTGRIHTANPVISAAAPVCCPPKNVRCDLLLIREQGLTRRCSCELLHWAVSSRWQYDLAGQP